MRGEVWTVRVKKNSNEKINRSVVGVEKRKRLDRAVRKGYDVRVRTIDGVLFQWGTWERIEELEARVREIERI